MILSPEKEKKANEILYVLDSLKYCGDQHISKIGLQKILYLAASLAPIKDVILSILLFQRWNRGPYSKDIQNIINYLVKKNLVIALEYRQIRGKNSLVNYKISPRGTEKVSNLIKSIKDEKIHWWIKTITILADTYSKQSELLDDQEYKGLDKITRLVYRDPTFIQIDEQKGRGGWYDLSEPSNETKKIIEYVINYVENSQFLSLEVENEQDERRLAELIAVAFFEYLISDYVKSKQNDNK